MADKPSDIKEQIKQAQARVEQFSDYGRRGDREDIRDAKLEYEAANKELQRLRDELKKPTPDLEIRDRSRDPKTVGHTITTKGRVPKKSTFVKVFEAVSGKPPSKAELKELVLVWKSLNNRDSYELKEIIETFASDPDPATRAAVYQLDMALLVDEYDIAETERIAKQKRTTTGAIGALGRKTEIDLKIDNLREEMARTQAAKAQMSGRGETAAIKLADENITSLSERIKRLMKGQRGAINIDLLMNMASGGSWGLMSKEAKMNIMPQIDAAMDLTGSLGGKFTEMDMKDILDQVRETTAADLAAEGRALDALEAERYAKRDIDRILKTDTNISDIGDGFPELDEDEIEKLLAGDHPESKAMRVEDAEKTKRLLKEQEDAIAKADALRAEGQTASTNPEERIAERRAERAAKKAAKEAALPPVDNVTNIRPEPTGPVTQEARWLNTNEPKWYTNMLAKAKDAAERQAAIKIVPGPKVDPVRHYDELRTADKVNRLGSGSKTPKPRGRFTKLLGPLGAAIDTGFAATDLYDIYKDRGAQPPLTDEEKSQRTWDLIKDFTTGGLYSGRNISEALRDEELAGGFVDAGPSVRALYKKSGDPTTRQEALEADLTDEELAGVRQRLGDDEATEKMELRSKSNRMLGLEDDPLIAAAEARAGRYNVSPKTNVEFGALEQLEEDVWDEEEENEALESMGISWQEVLNE